MSKNLSRLSFRSKSAASLFEEISDIPGNSYDEASDHIKSIAQEYLLGEANVLGALSFYDHFKPEHKNKQVFVCNGTACMLAGTQDQLRTQLNNYFKEDEIGEMCCLGRCHENSAFHYQGHNYSGQTIDALDGIVHNTVDSKLDHFSVRSLPAGAVLTRAVDFEFYRDLWQNVLAKTPDEALHEIEQSGLQGRGGAAFPMSDKLEACQKAVAKTKFVICNADEGDPGSYSDRYLLEHQPHAIIFGLLVSAYIVDAKSAIFYIRAEYPESISVMQKALSEWENWMAGLPVHKRPFFTKLRIVKGAGSYICGEETALIASIEGQRPEVRIRPPFPTEQGLFLKPTVVNNVETLANLPYIFEHGGQSYRKLGTPKSPGVKLVCLDSFFNAPGIVEVELGTPLTEIVNELGGGFKCDVKALQIGGPLGGIVPVRLIDQLTLDFQHFKSNGFDLGHASIVSIPADFPMIKYLEHLFQFAAHESCGKCFPCRLGTVRGGELLERAPSTPVDHKLMADLLDTLEQGSLCGLGTALPLPIRNALDHFQDELKPFFL